jgi:hypothetical protein
MLIRPMRHQRGNPQLLRKAGKVRKLLSYSKETLAVLDLAVEVA